LAKDAGNNAHAGTPADATRDANAVSLAVHWTRVDDVLAQVDVLSGKVLLTCSLPMSKDDSHMIIGHTASGAEALARMWYPRSVLFPAKCFFQCSKDAERERRRT